MATIIRSNDNAAFIIPDYRELLSIKKRSLLRKEVLLLSQNYGQYVYIRRKNVDQYEATFAQEQGFLLGETVWEYFGKPSDLIYCELLPHQTEALLVVVKSGSIHLDIQIPVDDIAHELATFQNQSGNFEIYIHGNVPISETPMEGCFTFDSNTVKSFTELDESLFENLPVNPAIKLLPVNDALRKQGLGSIPVKSIVLGLIGLIVIWYGWNLVKPSYKKVLPTVLINVVDPYTGFITALRSPAPDQEVAQLVKNIDAISNAPGWEIVKISYNNNQGFIANVISDGGSVDLLEKWAILNHVVINIGSKGATATLLTQTTSRKTPQEIYNLQSVIGDLIDKINILLPGNNIKIDPTIDRGQYQEIKLSILFDSISLQLLLLLGNQLKDLPLVLTDSQLTMNNDGSLSGQLSLTALGN